MVTSECLLSHWNRWSGQHPAGLWSVPTSVPAHQKVQPVDESPKTPSCPDVSGRRKSRHNEITPPPSVPAAATVVSVSPTVPMPVLTERWPPLRRRYSRMSFTVLQVVMVKVCSSAAAERANSRRLLIT